MGALHFGIAEIAYTTCKEQRPNQSSLLAPEKKTIYEEDNSQKRTLKPKCCNAYFLVSVFLCNLSKHPEQAKRGSLLGQGDWFRRRPLHAAIPQRDTTVHGPRQLLRPIRP